MATSLELLQIAEHATACLEQLLKDTGRLYDFSALLILCHLLAACLDGSGMTAGKLKTLVQAGDVDEDIANLSADGLVDVSLEDCVEWDARVVSISLKGARLLWRAIAAGVASQEVTAIH